MAAALPNPEVAPVTTQILPDPPPPLPALGEGEGQVDVDEEKSRRMREKRMEPVHRSAMRHNCHENTILKPKAPCAIAMSVLLLLAFFLSSFPCFLSSSDFGAVQLLSLRMSGVSAHVICMAFPSQFSNSQPTSNPRFPTKYTHRHSSTLESSLLFGFRLRTCTCASSAGCAITNKSPHPNGGPLHDEFFI